MLDKILLKKGLRAYNYKKTAWFHTISTETRQYKHNLMFYALWAAIGFIAVLFFSDVFRNRYDLLPSYAAPACTVLFLLAVLVWIKNVSLSIVLCLLAAVAGFYWSLTLSGGKNVYLVLVTLYPALAIQLRGSTRGSLWFLALMLSLPLVHLAQKTGVMPPWSVALSFVDSVTVAAASMVVFFISFLAERRQESMIDHLTDLLVFDEATGLPNKDVLAHSINPASCYIFAIIKIENFSDLVALFGYEFSDTISQFASRQLRKYEQRFGYTTYQLKYNEYGILIMTDKVNLVAEAAQLLTEVIKSLEIESLPWESDRIRLVYRVGGTVVNPEDARNPLSKADVALKKAERGHSVITIFDDDNTEKENAYDYVIRFTELINNRENGTFRAVFQPVFNSDGSAIEWYEALLRIRREDGSYTSIFPYLEVAKSTGFYQHLTDFILKRSADAICEFDVDVSVNISIHDIVRPEFLLLVDEVHEKIRDKKGRIIFEILESDELVELDKCIWFIDYISRYGFRIAIDDFGSGYSNYSSLVNLPIDIVKIDGSLIRKIKNDENAKMLVEGIVHFCKKSNKKTVAEYVEDAEVYESLKSMDIDFLQGYYLAQPSSACLILPEAGV